MIDLRWVLGLLACGAFTTWACSGSETGKPAAADSGGSAGMSGVGGDGKVGESATPGSCDVEDSCARVSGCDTFAQLLERCDADDLVVYASSCGGTYVESRGGVTASSWSFDAQGTLIGGDYEDEGHCSSWGKACRGVGSGRQLCGDMPMCIEHDHCDQFGANFGGAAGAGGAPEGGATTGGAGGVAGAAN